MIKLETLSKRGREFLNRMNGEGNEIGIVKKDMELPPYCDERRIKSAQRMYSRNYYSMLYGNYLGLITVLAIPSILNVLKATKKSSSSSAAYKRYIQTVFHTISLFRNDLKPGTMSWKYLQIVRNIHFHMSFVSQRDMSLAQFSFMGFCVMSRKELGIQCSNEELEDFCHYWRVLGYLHGITDEYNICCETLDETMERLHILRKEFFLPALSKHSKDFEEMSKYVVSGLQCFDYFDFYDSLIFNIKRLIGLPNFHYFESEISENYNRKCLKYLELSIIDRFNLFFSITSREILMNYWFFRLLFNFFMYIFEFLVRYFPIVAVIKFGLRKAYVKI